MYSSERLTQACTQTHARTHARSHGEPAQCYSRMPVHASRVRWLQSCSCTQIQEAPQYFLKGYRSVSPNSYEFEEQVQSTRNDTGPVLYAVSPVLFTSLSTPKKDSLPSQILWTADQHSKFKPLYSLPYAPASSVSPEDYPLAE